VGITDTAPAARPVTGMNSRERYLATLNFEPVDRVPLWEFGYWVGAVRRWYQEGLPQRVGIPDSMADGDIARGEALFCNPATGRPPELDIHEYFGLDPGLWHVPLNNFFAPEFVPKILEDRGDTVVARDQWGMVEARFKDNTTLSHFIRGPVQKRDDWEELKTQRLKPTMDGRLPADWDQVKEEFKVRNYPLAIGGGQGFFGSLRRLLGVEPSLFVFYDQPDLAHDIMDYLAEFWCTIYDQILNQIDVDVALIWEDMCYKNGPLISPDHFREFMLGPYQKLTGVFRDHGVTVILSDTDGNLWKLIPLFLESGVTGLYPFEAMAGMDVVEVRQAFPRLQMLGGIDKTALATGPAAIDAELEAKVPPMLRSRGYIPHADHAVGPDVSWANFKYYRQRLNEMILGSKSQCPN
jgi:uroporphyrinogen decarboxylase